MGICLHLQRLYVCNNGLSAEAAELLSKILMRDATVVGIEAVGTDVEVDAQTAEPAEGAVASTAEAETDADVAAGTASTTATSGSQVKKCPPLQVLHFYNNMSGDGGAKAVAGIVKACPQLHDFRFSATRSTPVGCEAIAEVNQIFDVVFDLFIYCVYVYCCNNRRWLICMILDV